MATDDSDGSLKLPRWFLVLCGLAMPGAVAWAWWVTGALVRLEIKLEATSTLRRQVATAETEFHNHLANPLIHEAMLSRLSDRINEMEKRITRNETELGRLRAGVDNGKKNGNASRVILPPSTRTFRSVNRLGNGAESGDL